MILFRDNPSTTGTYIAGSHYTQNPNGSFRFSKVLDGKQFREFMFSSEGNLFSTKIQWNSNLNSNLCHPNCADGQCVVSGVYSYLRAQDCTSCSANAVLKPPFGCTNEFRTIPTAATFGGFFLDHATINWELNSNITSCLNNTNNALVEAFKENWYFIILIFLLMIASLVGLLMIMKRHQAKQQALQNRIANYSGERSDVDE